MSPRYLTISIHDVTPFHQDVVRRILADLDQAALGPSTLLVVPRFHDRHPLDADPSFIDYLKQRTDRGDEICLHGFEHLDPHAGQGGILRKVVSRHYTAGEGEFRALSEEECERRICEGLRLFRELGFWDIRGFVAPAWLMRKGLENILIQQGFIYTTRLWHMVCFEDEVREHFAPACVHTLRTRLRKALSLIWNEALPILFSQCGILRFAIHPVDWNHPEVVRQTIRTIGRAARDRETLSYGQLAKILSERGGKG